MKVSTDHHYETKFASISTLIIPLCKYRIQYQVLVWSYKIVLDISSSITKFNRIVHRCVYDGWNTCCYTKTVLSICLMGAYSNVQDISFYL